jgi:hypothetical protein
MKIELLNWAVYLTQLPHDFVVAPHITLDEKAKCRETISELSRSGKNMSVKPVYLKSHSSRF